MSLNEEMGFSGSREARHVSIIDSGDKCRLVVIAAGTRGAVTGRLVIVEQLTPARAVAVL